MYKITKILDKNGNSKDNYFEEIQELHVIVSCPKLIRDGGCFCMLLEDDIGKILRTSPIEEYENDNGKIKVVTSSNIYYLEEIK